MSQTKRAGIAIALMVVGWCFMGIAYDKPQWYFIASGIIGATIFFVALGWWILSALALHDRRKAEESAGTNNVKTH